MRNSRSELRKSSRLERRLGLVIFAVVFAAFPIAANAQQKCGAEGQRPCKLWERIPSCDKGLREDFRLSMCVGPRTQVDATTGKYLGRRKEPKMTWAVLCNRSSRPMIDVALAQYTNPEYSWVTNGWIRVPSGRCEKVGIDDDYTGAIYVYAKAQDGTEWNDSESQFCIKPYEAFETPNADSLRCETRDFAIVNMVRHNVKPGNNTINFAN